MAESASAPRKTKAKSTSREVVEVEDASPIDAKSPLRSQNRNPTATDTNMGFTAIVLGGTGAVGRYVVQELLASDHWSKVIAIGRRTGAPTYYPESDRLLEVISDLDGICEPGSALNDCLALHRPIAAFCCLGTTRKIAGSDEQFKRVDYKFVTDFAWTCRQHRVEHFSLISSMGSSASSPFLYPRTKGKSENYIKALNFLDLIIYRPGLLGRDEARSDEKFWGHVMSALPAAFFSKVIVGAATQHLQHSSQISAQAEDKGEEEISLPSQQFKRVTWDNDSIYKFAKQHNIPKMKRTKKKK